MFKKILFFSIVIALYASCSKDLKKPGETGAVSMANEWWVTVTDVDGNDLIGTHVQIATYNTSDNGDSIWVDDYGNIWPFKAKVLANYSGLTFNATNSANVSEDDATMTITEGQVLPKLGVSKTGIVTDSIYMKAEFSDDPGTIYIVSGHARTRWRDDDY